MKTLDFSLREEPRLWVKFEGWPAAEREEFMRRMNEIEGVQRVVGAGGTVGAYVYHDPAIQDTSAIEQAIKAIAKELRPDYA